MLQLGSAVVCAAILIGNVAAAATINGMYYVAGPTLNRIAFNGTEFDGGGVVLENIFPQWTAMSYDATGGYMYYVAGPTLNRVAFNGVEFDGGGVELENIFPQWTAMSLGYAPVEPTPVPLPGTMSLAAGGVVLFGAISRRRRLRQRPPGDTG